MFLLVFHRALPDLQRMKLCYSVGTSPTPSSLDSRSSEFLTSGRCTLAPLCVPPLDADQCQTAGFSFSFSSHPWPTAMSFLGARDMHTRLVFFFILALVFDTNSFAQTAGDALLTTRSPLQGAMVADLSPKLATELGLDPQRKGVVITNIAEGSAAQAVGFQRGDVILSLNQKISDVADLERMTNSDSLLWRVAIERRGQQISVVFTDERKNAQQEAIIQRERARDKEGAMTQTPSSQSSTPPSHQVSPVIPQRNPEYRPDLGIRVQQVTDDIARTFGMTEARGVLVRGIDEKSPARSAGFEIGDLILKIDGQDVTDLGDLLRIITKVGVGKDVSVIIIRMGEEQAKTVRIGSVASLRTPACEDFYPLSQSNSPSLREQLFAKRFDDMSSGEIDQAIGIISRCEEAVKAWPQSRLKPFTDAMLHGVKYTLGLIKSQQLARERRVRDADEAALRGRLEAERKAAEVDWKRNGKQLRSEPKPRNADSIADKSLLRC